MRANPRLLLIPAAIVLTIALASSPVSPLAWAASVLPSGTARDDAGLGLQTGEDDLPEGPDSTVALQGDLVAAFYYQGFLTEDEHPVTGTRSMEFQLWSTDKEPEQVGVTLTREVAVQDGQFNTSLGWGPDEFNGRGVKILVRVQDSTGTWHDLPRSTILPVPYAMSLKPGAKVVSREYDPAITVVGAAGVGLNSTGSETGVMGYTTGLDASDAGVKGLAMGAGGDARGGAFSSVTGVGLYGASLGDHGVVGLGCSLPNCYGGHFTGDSGIYAEANDDTPVSYAGNFVGKVNVTGGLQVDGPAVFSGDVWSLSVTDRARLNSVNVTGTLTAGALTVQGPAVGFFPRPRWDSHWQAIARGATKTLTHNLGGEASYYFVDFQCRDTASSGLGINVAGYGGLSVAKALDPTDSRGAYYRNLESSTVDVYRLPDDDFCDEIRVRLWVIE